MHTRGISALRRVSSKRAKKLRKRGEDVVWKVGLDTYVWCMTHKYHNRWKGDRSRVEIY